MRHLLENWVSRTFGLIALSTLVMSGFYLLEFTEWAEQINRLPASHDVEGRERPPAILLVILPFVKQAIFIIVPAGITVGILALLKKYNSKGNSHLINE